MIPPLRDDALNGERVRDVVDGDVRGLEAVVDEPAEERVDGLDDRVDGVPDRWIGRDVVEVHLDDELLPGLEVRDEDLPRVLEGLGLGEREAMSAR